MAKNHPDQYLDGNEGGLVYLDEMGHEDTGPHTRYSGTGAGERSHRQTGNFHQDERPVFRGSNITGIPNGAAYGDSYPDHHASQPRPGYGEPPRRIHQKPKNQREQGEGDHPRDRDDRECRPETSVWSDKTTRFINGVKTKMSRESNNHGPSQGPTRGPARGHAIDDFDSLNTGSQSMVYRREFERLQHQLSSANSSIDTLKAELQLKDGQAAQLKKRNNAMQSARDAQEELLGRQEQDLTISANFEGIFLQLKSWTSKFCNAAKYPMTVTGIHKDNLSQIRRVLPSLQDHEDLPRLLPPNDLRRRRRFVRGWVALILAETMIRSLPVPSHPASSGHDLWMPPETRGAVRELETTLLSSGEAVALTAFHRWRTITMALLSKVYPPARWPQDTINSVEDKVDFTLKVIHPLNSKPDIGELRQKLIDNVFLPALEFSQLLRRQCASWSVRFPPLMPVNPLPHDEYAVIVVFEASTMEDVDSQSEDDLETSVDHCLKSVEIVVTPALVKSGNHDGLRYDTESTMKKAEVSCAEIGMAD